MLPCTRLPVAGSTGICPDTKSRLPAWMAGEYAPRAFGASAAEIARRTSGSLDDLAVAQAPRAHANPFGGAFDQRSHRLQVRLEPAWSHVVRVRNRSAHHRTLVADLAPLRHDLLFPRAQSAWAQTMNCSSFTAESGRSGSWPAFPGWPAGRSA